MSWSKRYRDEASLSRLLQEGQLRRLDNIAPYNFWGQGTKAQAKARFFGAAVEVYEELAEEAEEKGY